MKLFPIPLSSVNCSANYMFVVPVRQLFFISTNHVNTFSTGSNPAIKRAAPG
eukprot:UN09341